MIFFSFEGMAQTTPLMESFNSSGGTVTGSSGSISYSIGQVVYTYIEDHVEQGIQHGELSQNIEEDEENNKPEDIDSVVEAEIIPESPEINVLIYPNPTTDFINLATNGLLFENENNSYQLFNYQGKLLMQNSISQDNTTIHLDHLSTSIYILHVYVNYTLYKTFKILKK